VVVAARPVSRGSPLSPSDLRVTRLPRAYVAPGSYSRIEQVSGRVALADLSPGEAVTKTRLARVRAGPVASLIPEGLRAFAVPTTLPPGAVVPGDRVDVLATYGSGQPHTEVVVTGVEVLGVLGPSGIPAGPGGATSDVGLDASGSGAGGSGTLILLVSQEDEGRLAYARAFADIQVAIAPAGSFTPPGSPSSGR
jgi:Flp pilus assembly protein CpaB